LSAETSTATGAPLLGRTTVVTATVVNDQVERDAALSFTPGSFRTDGNLEGAYLSPTSGRNPEVSPIEALAYSLRVHSLGSCSLKAGRPHGVEVYSDTVYLHLKPGQTITAKREYRAAAPSVPWTGMDPRVQLALSGRGFAPRISRAGAPYTGPRVNRLTLRGTPRLVANGRRSRPLRAGSRIAINLRASNRVPSRSRLSLRIARPSTRTGNTPLARGVPGQGALTTHLRLTEPGYYEIFGYLVSPRGRVQSYVCPRSLTIAGPA
jgi:hypothetical protein